MRNKKQLLSTILRLEILEDRTVLSALLPGSADLFTGPTVPATNSSHPQLTKLADPDAAADLAISQKEQSAEPHSSVAPAEGANISPGPLGAHPEDIAPAGAIWSSTDSDPRGDVDVHPDSLSREARLRTGPIPEDERTDAEAATMLTGFPAVQHRNDHDAFRPMDLPFAGVVCLAENELRREAASPEWMSLEVSWYSENWMPSSNTAT